MFKVRKKITILCVLLSMPIFGCTKNKEGSPEPEKQATNSSPSQKPIKDVLRVNNEKDCTIQGGAWIFNGKGATTKGIKTCHYIHTDQNKPCMDGTECGSGTCFADETSNQGFVRSLLKIRSVHLKRLCLAVRE